MDLGDFEPGSGGRPPDRDDDRSGTETGGTAPEAPSDPSSEPATGEPAASDGDAGVAFERYDADPTGGGRGRGAVPGPQGARGAEDGREPSPPA